MCFDYGFVGNHAQSQLSIVICVTPLHKIASKTLCITSLMLLQALKGNLYGLLGKDYLNSILKTIHHTQSI